MQDKFLNKNCILHLGNTKCMHIYISIIGNISEVYITRISRRVLTTNVIMTHYNPYKRLYKIAKLFVFTCQYKVGLCIICTIIEIMKKDINNAISRRHSDLICTYCITTFLP